LPELIEESVNALEKAGLRTPASYSDGYIINERGQRVGLFSSEYTVPIGRNTYKELLIWNWIPALSVLYRRSVLLECGLFDEQCHIEDYDILLRVSKEYGRLHYIRKQLFLYRRHSTNYSSNSDKMNEQYEVLLAKHSDLRRFRRFKTAVKNRDLAAVARNATRLNVELRGRQAVRVFQSHHGLVNVGYRGVMKFFVEQIGRRVTRTMRASALRARGVQVGKGVKIDGKVTIVGNPGNIVLCDNTRILGDIRLITGPSRDRELIRIGCHTTIGHGATLFSHGGQLMVGDRCFLGPRVHIEAKGGLRIGDDTMVAANVSMFASDHVVANKDVLFSSQGERFEGISIGRNCCFGAACVILDGTVVEDNCLVDAGCVLRGNYAADSRIVSKDAIGIPLA
jgi:acetyltransferase-like isoleucine patch superfamily enzyme